MVARVCLGVVALRNVEAPSSRSAREEIGLEDFGRGMRVAGSGYDKYALDPGMLARRTYPRARAKYAALHRNHGQRRLDQPLAQRRLEPTGTSERSDPSA